MERAADRCPATAAGSEPDAAGGSGGNRWRESVLDNAEPRGAAAAAVREAKPVDEPADAAREARRRARRRRGDAGGEDGGEAVGGGAAAAWEEGEWGPEAAAPLLDDDEWGWSEAAALPPAGGAAAAASAWGDEAVSEAAARAARREARRARRRAAAAAPDESDPRAAPRARPRPEEAAGGGFVYGGRDGGAYAAGADAADADADSTNAGAAPDIAVLSAAELDRVLPILPLAAQATFFAGGAAEGVQRWAACLAATVLLSKVAALAAGSLTWPLWWPWARAAQRNYVLRKAAGAAGLWRARVLAVEARGRPRAGGASDDDDASGGDAQARRRRARFSTMRSTRVVLGDAGGAQTELLLPHDARHALIEVGAPAELVVLAARPDFADFRAVRDVYLPDAGLWLSEYPYLDRPAFLALSLEVEREAAAARGGGEYAADGAAGGDGYDDGEYYPPPPPPRW